MPVMEAGVTIPVNRWTLRYEPDAEPVEVRVPHAWRQDVPLAFEGPVVYHTLVDVPRGESHLLFRNVSYAAEIWVDGDLIATHKGIWDAFAVRLDAFAGRSVSVDVVVTKNGGLTYPVRDVASGFLPYVFHTFGGIFGEVDLVGGPENLDLAPATTRAHVDGTRLYVDGRPFYIRGLLHWGWYPELGHTNVPEATIREELRAAKARGFNLVKFCLWVPPQRYLEIMREEGMEAWMELPLWDPSSDAEHLAEIAAELERIVRQYRHHDNIIVWTVGCELSASTPAPYREYLTNLVHNLTGCPLVKDNSGGAEMYGGDLREYGTFYDFHPYCDLPFYPPVLDSLLPGARPEMPILLGEFNDVDVHRDLARTGDELPYWASTLSELNDKGVRWQYDLPEVLNSSRFSNQPTRSRHAALMASSCSKAIFTRKVVHEAVRARDGIAGYVVTGWRDTPISSSGFFDDWNEARFSPADVAAWNGPSVLFLLPTRRPPWVYGGNRPGWVDPFNHFAGQVFWRVGVHAEWGIEGGLVWKVVRSRDGKVVAYGASESTAVSALTSSEVGQIVWDAEPGEYRLEVEFGGVRNRWPVWVLPRPEWSDVAVDDPEGVLRPLAGIEGARRIATHWNPEADVVLLRGEGTIRAPFWREAAYEFRNDAFWASVPFAERWERLLPVSGEVALNERWLREKVGEYEVLMNRVDVRTYADLPVLVRTARGLITTLRPYGGLGTQPTSLAVNPAGAALLQALLDFTEQPG